METTLEEGPMRRSKSQGFFTLVYFLRSPPGPLPCKTDCAFSSCFNTVTHSGLSWKRWVASVVAMSTARCNEETSSVREVSSAVIRLL